MRARHGFLAIILLLATVVATPTSAASAPPTLSTGAGEVLLAAPPYRVTDATLACPTYPDGSATFTVSGDARGPYRGTFTETVTVSVAGMHVTALTATFHITARNGDVTGIATLTTPGTGEGACDIYALALGAATSYTATIVTPKGTFHDTGTSRIVGELLAPSTGFVDEDFTSSLAPKLPKDAAQCQNNGYKNYTDPRTGQPFMDQERCIRYVDEHSDDNQGGNNND